jgi:hypothetical protein
VGGTALAPSSMRSQGAKYASDHRQCKGEDFMGKYFLAWLLGVPAGLLLLIFVVTHLF